MSISVSAQVEIRECTREAEAITAKPKISKEDRTRFEFLMGRISLLRSGQLDDSVRREEAKRLAIETGVYVEDRNTLTAAQKEFREFVSTGAIPERRTYVGMNESANNAGGYLVDSDFRNQLFKGMAQIDPLFDAENVNLILTDNAKPLALPGVDLTQISASVVSEQSQHVPTKNPTITRNVLKGFSYRVDPVAASIELEQDASVVTLSQVLNQAYAVGFARGVGADLINGDGSSAPKGILAAATDSTVVAGSSGFFTHSELLAVYGSVNRIFRASSRCAWMMNDSLYLQVLGLHDDSGLPLIRTTEDGEKLLGKRVLISPSMPTAAGSKALAFGDLGQYSVRATGMRINRSTELPGYAEMGTALFTAMMRVDAALNTAGGTAPIVYAKLGS
jgi:HK97 family phage major capsid protein